MLAFGGSVVAGKFLGEKNVAAASAIFTRILVVQIVSGVVIMALGLLFLDGLIFLLGADEAVSGLVAEYLVVLLWAMPIFMVGICFEYFVRVDGRPVLAGAALLFEACQADLDSCGGSLARCHQGGVQWHLRLRQ